MPSKHDAADERASYQTPPSQAGLDLRLHQMDRTNDMHQPRLSGRGSRPALRGRQRQHV